MTNKYLSGAYPDGYALNAKYTGLVIDSTATVGGSGVSVAFNATIQNLGAVSATGYQANGVYLNAGGMVTNGSTLDTTALIEGQHAGVFTRNASATIANFGTILSLGVYSAGVYLYAGGTVINGSAGDTTALIASHYPTSRSGSPGVYAKAATATVVNFGTIRGSGYYGNGVQLNAGGTVTNGSATDTAAFIVGYNFGLVAKGAVVVSNFGTIKSSYFDGLLLTAGGTVTNGSATDAAALIVGYNFGVYAQGATTITNFGTITSDTSAAVAFHSASDRLVAEAGSKFFGAVQGGGGTLELVGGSGTISGLGAGAVLTGAVTANVSGFGAYVLDAGGSWTLTGTNTLAANQRLTDFGAINGSLALGSASSRLIVGSGASISGAVAGGGGTLELVSGTGTITGLGGVGTITGGVAMTFSGFGTYQLDAGTSWTLTGTNTLAQPSQTLTVGGSLTNTGALTGAAGAAGADSAQGNGGGGGAGGLGIAVAASGTVANGGTLRGGAGGAGGFGYHYGGGGGAGANGANLASGGILTNTATVAGGAGGVGGAAYYDSPGVGGVGGVGVALAGAGTVTNTGGTISGGAGGVGGGATEGYHDSSAGGTGGAGVTLAGVATLTNTGGTIAGGAGGKGGSGYTNGGDGGAGAAGVLATAGGTISNTGAILGGAGGAGGAASGSRYHGGAAGAAGDGIVLTAGGTVINGSKTVTVARISGLIGVYAGPTGAATVTNFGTIQGTGGVAVQFQSASDKLIAEAGSTWIGSVQGGGGMLDLANGTGTVTGIGSTGVVTGAEAMSFSGFGSYVFGKGTWTLAGTNTLAAGASLTDNAKLTNTGALSLAGSVGGKGALTFAGGTTAIDAGAKITVASLSLTGGTTSLNESLTYKGAFSETTTATLTVASGDKLTLSGASALGGLINGAGTISAADATLNKGLVIGGTDVLTITGAATQTGLVTIGDATAAGAAAAIAAGATWTINGAFGIAEGTATTSSLTVAGTLIKSGATGKSVIALATTDTGLIEAAIGTLDFAAAITGTGALKIDAGAVLEADGAVGKTLTASFNGGTATLALKAPTTFAATIAGFAPTDTIDLLKIAATGASINAKDQLVIVNGATTVARLQLTGTYTGATFTIGADGHGGTNVTLATAASVPPPAAASPTPATHAFVAAMAYLGATAASASVAASHVDAWRPTLLAPRTQSA